MLSRVANSIYWMNAYLERAENVSRFIEVNLQLILDLPQSIDPKNQWESLVLITGDEQYFFEKYKKATLENVIQFHTYDREYPNSIISCVTAARENARSIREIISSEMWEQINRFYLMVLDSQSRGSAYQNPFNFFTEVKTACHLFNGISNSTMTHGEAWNFGRMGLMLERADKTSRILDVKYFLLLPGLDYVGTSIDDMQWAAVLKSTSALEMYRKKFKHISPDKVADFLILDRNFPRSILYSLIAAEIALSKITGSTRNVYQNQAEQALGKLRSNLEYTNITEIFAFGLHEYLDKIQTDLIRIGEAIYSTFLHLDCSPTKTL